jgi:dTMP kinase
VTGRFLTLEGGEGVGKSTQARRLAAALRARGLDVVETREPGGSAGAEAIRAMLLQGDPDRWTARSEALLFAAARADHVARTIRPALEAGRWVVCDRYLDSSLAYQGSADGIGEEAIRMLHTVSSEGLLPDRTFLLEIESGIAASREGARDGGRRDRIGGRQNDYHQNVAAAFRRLADAEPARIRTIDGSGSPDSVTTRMIAALADLL